MAAPKGSLWVRAQLGLPPLLLLTMALAGGSGTASAEAFDSVLGDTASCHRACQLTYPLHTYPKVGPSEPGVHPPHAAAFPQPTPCRPRNLAVSPAWPCFPPACTLSCCNCRKSAALLRHGRGDTKMDRRCPFLWELAELVWEPRPPQRGSGALRGRRARLRSVGSSPARRGGRRESTRDRAPSAPLGGARRLLRGHTPRQFRCAVVCTGPRSCGTPEEGFRQCCYCVLDT